MKVVSPASAGPAVAMAKSEDPATLTVSDVRASGFKEIVAGSLPPGSRPASVALGTDDRLA